MANNQAIDLSKLNLEQLQALVPAAQERIAELEEKQRKQAFDKVRAAAEAVGMSPAELLKHFGAAKPAKKPVKPKYRNPGNAEETWTGRGRKPEWVAAWLKSGKELAELEIAGG
jgi:DNA-binding protein H-NS